MKLPRVLLVSIWKLFLHAEVAATISLPQDQLNVLFEIYNSTGGDAWRYHQDGPYWNFSSPVQIDPCADYSKSGFPECWEGIECTRDPEICALPNTTCEVKTLFLRDYNLVGAFPAAFGDLTTLEYMYVRSNDLGGEIPTSLGKLQLLKDLYIDNNLLSGTIPCELASLTNLEILSLEFNLLTQTLPSCLATLPQLLVISVFENFLSGAIPSEYGSWPHLETMFFGENMLSQEIPRELSQLSELRYLHLQFNRLSGELPSAIGLLPSLEYADLNTNHFTGWIPDEVTNLVHLSFLGADDNFLSGPLPASIGLMPRLEQLYLQSNRLSGSLPSSLSQSPRLAVVLLQNNQFSGRLDKICREDAPFGIVDFSNNKFSGSLPSMLFSLPRITSIAAVNNCFRGELPASICDSKTVQAISLDGLSSACHDESIFSLNIYTDMKGTIPSCLFNMSSLKELHLSGNGFFGNLDAFQANNLSILVLSHNHLTGEIPVALLEQPFAQIDLSHNRLSYTLDDFTPSPITRETDYAKLDLKVNRLSGVIPSAVASAVRHVEILSGNSFSCQNKRNIPDQDPDKQKFSCGSSDLDESLYLTIEIALFYVVVLVVAKVLVSRGCDIGYLGKGHVDRVLAAMRLSDDTRREYPHLTEINYFFQVLTLLKTSCVYLAVLICLVCIPLYGFLKFGSVSDSYRTHTFQYNWLISATKLSGVVPAVLIYLTWAMLVLVLFSLFIKCSNMLKSTFVDRAMSVDNSKFLCMSRRSLYLVVSSGSFLCLNIVVSLVLNGLFVFLVVSDVSSKGLFWAQVSIALFRLFWGKVVSAIIHQPKLRLMRQTKVYVLIVAYLFNNIVAPSLAFMCTDTSCFYNTFVKPESVTSTYSSLQCEWFRHDDVNGLYCFTYGLVQFSTEYVPSFVYNYECGSSLLQTFVPIFILSCAISMFISLALITVSLSEVELTKYLPTALHRMVPRLLVYDDLIPRVKDFGALLADSSVLVNPYFENSAEVKDVKDGSYIENEYDLLRSPAEIAMLVERVALLLTFGIASPYLAIVAATSGFLLWLKCFTLIANYKHRLKSPAIMMSTATLSTNFISVQEAKIFNSLNWSCTDIGRVSIEKIWLIISLLSSVLIGLLAGDLASDEDDVSLISAFMFPLVSLLSIILLYFIFERFARNPRKHLNQLRSWAHVANLLNTSHIAERSLSSETSPSDDLEASDDAMLGKHDAFSRPTSKTESDRQESNVEMRSNNR